MQRSSRLKYAMHALHAASASSICAAQAADWHTPFPPSKLSGATSESYLFAGPLVPGTIYHICPPVPDQPDDADEAAS